MHEVHDSTCNREVLMTVTVTVLSDLLLAEDGIVQLFRLCVHTVDRNLYTARLHSRLSIAGWL